MADNDNDTERPTHQHFYITPAILPKDGDSDTEWIQRVTMLADVGEQLARHIYMYLRAVAPIVMQEESLAWHLLAGLGLTLRGIAATGRERLEKAGTAPLDATEEQAKVIRDELARPGLNPELRDALLTILQHNLEHPPKPTPAEDAEWPEGGFTIGGDE